MTIRTPTKPAQEWQQQTGGRAATGASRRMKTKITRLAARRFGLVALAAMAAAALEPSVAIAAPKLAAAKAHAALPAPDDAADRSLARDVEIDSAGYGGEVGLPSGGSRVLRFNHPIGRALLGDPTVADLIPLSDHSLYVLGRKPGSTSLTIMAREHPGSPLVTVDLRVGFDVDSLQRALIEYLPDEKLLRASARGGTIVLTGVLSSSAAAARAQMLAESYAPAHVVNMTSIRGAEQVMISVRVAEVQRNALVKIGLENLNSIWDDAKTGVMLAPPQANPAAVANFLGRTKVGEVRLDALFDALETKGYASTLAEPTLVALSGETAVFFAGGEYPVPVPQSTGAGGTEITIYYKTYGVSIAFTPTVYGDTIDLIVAPEVSALDKQNGVQLNGFVVPGITARRAKTTVELRNGQTFVIGGLIQHEFSDSLNGIPGVANLPVLGPLFRSTSFQHDQSEVVILVTARLAQPSDRAIPVLPTDLHRAPTAAELFLLGKTDAPVSPATPPAAADDPFGSPQAAAKPATRTAQSSEAITTVR